MVWQAARVAFGAAMLGVTLIGIGGSTVSAQEPIFCFDRPATIVATSGVVNGTSKSDVIVVPEGGAVTVNAKGGDDYICSQNLNATIYAGAGDDAISGSGTFYGDAGNDYLVTDNASNLQQGQPGAWFYGGSGDDTIGGENVAYTDGGSGNDSIHIDNALFGVIHGGSGNDFIQAHGVSEAYGDAGNDTIDRYDNDLIDCGTGIDTMINEGAAPATVRRCERSYDGGS